LGPSRLSSEKSRLYASKLQEKVDELTGTPISDWLVLPPKPRVPK
jgi:hypothetical protein